MNKLTDIPVKVISDIDNFYNQVMSDIGATKETYHRGYANGIILCHATLHGSEPNFINAPEEPTNKTETGWLIERADSEPSKPFYFAGLKDGQFSTWSYDNLKAIRFARKEDAEKIDTGIFVRIAEHAWN